MLVAAALAVTVGAAPASARHDHDGPPERLVDRFRPAGVDLDDATIPQLQAAMDSRRLSALRLTLTYLARIRTLDPWLGSVVDVDRRGAIREAIQSDLRRRRGQVRGPLDGIPVLLKDNIDTTSLIATAGSRLLLGTSPDEDAVVVQRLRDAGAVVLGKANLSEWANFRSFNSTSGWSGVGGLTANPHVLDRNPCGSSSGSAAAVAASLAQVALGTETNGSVVCPASQTGVVGHKPTLGLVSRTGIVPISVEQDTAGPIARHVVDAALTLGALQGRDPADPATADIPADQPTDYAALLDDDALQGARIGVWVPFDAAGYPPEARDDLAAVQRVVDDAVAAIEAEGATPVPVSLPDQGEIGNDSFTALRWEFVRDLEAYLAGRPGGPDTLPALIEGNRADPIELKYFDQQLFLDSQETFEDLTAPEAEALRANARRLAQASIDDTMAANDLDAIMAPTNSPAWLTTLGEGDAFLFGSSTPAAVAGYPNVTVPAGAEGPLPVGVNFFAGRFEDAKVLSFAYDFEDATDARLTPRFVPSIGGDGDRPDPRDDRGRR